MHITSYRHFLKLIFSHYWLPFSSVSYFTESPLGRGRVFLTSVRDCSKEIRKQNSSDITYLTQNLQWLAVRLSSALDLPLQIYSYVNVGTGVIMHHDMLGNVFCVLLTQKLRAWFILATLSLRSLRRLSLAYVSLPLWYKVFQGLDSRNRTVQDQTNCATLIDKTFTDFKTWTHLPIPWMERLHVLKMDVLPRFLYWFQTEGYHLMHSVFVSSISGI